MALATTSSSVEYTGTGAVTAYSVPFAFLESAHLVATQTDTGASAVVLTEGVDYSVTGAGDEAGGTLTLVTALPADSTLLIERTVPLTQETSFATQGHFSPSVHEEAFDKLTMGLQQLTREDTSIRVDVAEDLADLRADFEAAPDAATLDERTVLSNGSTTARKLKHRFAERLNVRDFGAMGDGITDDTAAIKAALAAAAANGSTVFVPKGTFVVAPVLSADKANSITVPDGVQLVGEGYDSVLRMRAAGLTDGSWRVISLLDHASVRNLRLDGNRGAVDRTGLASVSVTFLYGGVDTTAVDVILEDLWIHDIIGISLESFGMLWTVGSARLVVRNCKGYSNEGTPFSANGNINTGAGNWYDGALMDGALFEGCEGWSNTWQGVSLYAAKNVQVIGGRFFSNSQNGINCEWTQAVDVIGAKSFNNGQAGFGTWGAANARLIGCHLSGNNTTATVQGGELRFRPYTYETSGVRGIADTIEVIDCKVEPVAGGYHLWQEFDATVTQGPPSTNLQLHQQDAADWDLRNTYSFDAPLGGLRIYRVEPRAAMPRSPLSSWGNGGASVSSSGTITTFTGTAQFHNRFGQSILKPGRTYRLRARHRQDDATGEWQIIAQDGAGAIPAKIILKPAAGVVGTWRETDMCFTIAPTVSGNGLVKVMLMTASVTSSLSLEWLVVEELAGSSTPSSVLSADKVMVGSATWDPPSVASGATTSTTISVRGAAIGDRVAASFSLALPAGVVMVGHVTATDTVTVTAINLSGGAVDLASGTVRVDVWG